MNLKCITYMYYMYILFTKLSNIIFHEFLIFIYLRIVTFRVDWICEFLTLLLATRYKTNY